MSPRLPLSTLRPSSEPAYREQSGSERIRQLFEGYVLESVLGEVHRDIQHVCPLQSYVIKLLHHLSPYNYHNLFLLAVVPCSLEDGFQLFTPNKKTKQLFC